MKVRRKSSPREDEPEIPDLLLEAELERRELDAELLRAHARKVQACREDVDEFCAYVGRDAETNERITQEPIHEEFQALADLFPRLILMSFPESGKTSQLGILRILWHLGRNPNLRVAVVSKTGDKATQITRAIRSYIEKSKELAEVFPELIPGESWTESSFIVRRPVHSRDPSVQALGLYDAVTGSRIDILVLDDVLDAENTATPEARKKVLKRIRGTYIDRVSKEGRILFLTNAWHPEDAAHVLEKDGWHCARYASVDEDGRLSWAAKWDKDRLDQARLDMGPLEFARAHLCRARDEGESPFDEDALTRAIEAAADLELVYRIDPAELPPGAVVITGVDLATGEKKKGSHLTALVTILLWPEDNSRQLLWVEAGRWSSAEIRERVLDHDRRYLPTFVVENNAAQRWIFDIIRNQADLPEEERRLPTLVPFTTGSNKAHPQFGVEGLAVEIDRGDWLFPKAGLAKAAEEVEALLADMRYYVRGAHTGDRLMALWFAREFARRGKDAGKSEREEERDLEPDHGGAVSATIIDGGAVDAQRLISFT